MKTLVLLWLGICGVLSAAAEVDWTAWQWEAPFEVEQSGMVRLEVPPAVLDVSQPDLGDIRVLAPGGVEAPYLVDVPSRRQGVMRDGAEFKAVLSGRSTVITARAESTESIEAVRLVSPAREFLKSVTIEGRQGGGEWRNLAESEVVFRQIGGVERLQLPVPAGKWGEFRVTVDDGRSLPVPFTGLRLVSPGANPETSAMSLPQGKREELPGESRITFDLGAGNLDVAGLRLEIPDALFSRPCDVAFPVPVPNGGTRLENVGSSALYRVADGRGASTEELFIPVRRRIAARFLTVTLHNGDSPPLSVTGAALRAYPTILVFHAGNTGRWRLVSGNRGVRTPAYDLGSLRAALSAAGGRRLTAGPLRLKDGYQKSPQLPGVEPAGADIGLADWGRRRAVKSASPGVIRIELDARVLAACRSDLGDLRLVRNGRQIPYLVLSQTAMRELKPVSVSLMKDPKHPTVSRWEVALPVAGLPVAGISARSPATLFSRRFLATVERKDELGNRWTDQVGTADWRKSGASEVPLRLACGGKRIPAAFTLETDHGDNPAIGLEDVVVRFAAPSIIAKLIDDAPLSLYYGNPKALAPQYDLSLVRKELLAADPQVVTLGDEELLKPVSAKLAVDAGSPWLWLALGAVVVALLVIVAKLLPRPVVQ